MSSGALRGRVWRQGRGRRQRHVAGLRRDAWTRQQHRDRGRDGVAGRHRHTVVHDSERQRQHQPKRMSGRIDVVLRNHHVHRHVLLPGRPMHLQPGVRRHGWRNSHGCSCGHVPRVRHARGAGRALRFSALTLLRRSDRCPPRTRHTQRRGSDHERSETVNRARPDVVDRQLDCVAHRAGRRRESERQSR